MPQLKPLTLNDGTSDVIYNINGNNQGVTAWQKPGVDQRGDATLTVVKRAAKSSQTTRKSALTLTVPLTTVCPNTCAVTTRGSILLKVEVITSVESTQAERSAAYAQLQDALADPDLKIALSNNESFWS